MATRAGTKKRSAGPTGSLRIIGGEWRGRKLPVADLPGLRPTTDRIRETVFNWLAGELRGRQCLDLFAGSGALGLEALSRGADSCCFVEQNAGAAALLSRALDTLGAGSRGRVIHGDALGFLDRGALNVSDVSPPDLLFLDPPFASNLLAQVLSRLAEHCPLAPDALVYLEYSAQSAPQVPEQWTRWKHKRSGSLIYEIYARG